MCTYLEINGAQTFFIPFNSQPRNAMEKLILEYICPKVVGDVQLAAAAGWQGVEWWIQDRYVADSKEYHLDTAITWCSENGWTVLEKCPFYPTIASIVYIDDIGGPTVVFNQTMTSSGIYPYLPEEIWLSYPHKNKMMLFNGNLLHGVLNSISETNGDKRRRTLLINYWKGDKMAGTKAAHIDANSDDELAAMAIMDKMKLNDIYSHNSKRNAMVEESSEVQMYGVDFIDDIIIWKSKWIPSAYKQAIDRYHETASPSSVSTDMYHMKLKSSYANSHLDWLSTSIVNAGQTDVFMVGNWFYWLTDNTTASSSVTCVLVLNNKYKLYPITRK